MIVGRDAVRSRIAALLASARDGRGGALLLAGPAGIGKTTLLEDAASAPGMAILRAAGTPSEQTLTWSGLHQLLRPLLPRLEGLLPAQREALAAAVALSDTDQQPDRLRVASGVLSLLSAAGRERPVLVLVDDVQWLDEPSVDALVFAARRLDDDSVAVLVGQRTDDEGGRPLHGLPVVAVEGLAPDDAVTLLRATRPQLRATVARSLADATGGHPLAMVEAVAGLTREQLAGAAALDDPLPVGTAVEQLYRRRLDDLPPDCVLALLVAALGGAADRQVVESAWAALGRSVEDLEQAEQARLVTVEPRRISFHHPLVAAAVGAYADAVAHRRAHAALAAAVEPGTDAALWHAAAACSGPDAALSDALAALGRRHMDTAPQTAERAFATAAELAATPDARSAALLRAASACAGTGSAERAERYLDECLALTDDPIRTAEATHLLGLMRWKSSSPGPAAELLVQAAEVIAPRDPGRAAQMLADALEPWLVAGEPERAYSAAGRAQELVPADDRRLRVAIDLRVADALGWQGRTEQACALWHRTAVAVEQDAELMADAWTRYFAGEARFSAGDDADAAAHLRAALDLSRAAGAMSAVPYMAIVTVWTLCRLGELDEAGQIAEEAVALARMLGNVGDEAWALAAAAWVDSWRGDELSCRRHAAEAEDLAAALDMRGLEAADPALGALELSRGRYDAAIDHLARAVTEHRQRGHGDAGAPRPVTPLLVEALIRAGRRDEAIALMAEFEGHAGSSPAALAATARCRGLLAGDDDASTYFAEAVRLHAQAGHRLDLARTQLVWGERLRRMRRRAEARVQLHAAGATFADLGAALWQARTWTEVEATGERRRVDETDRDRLTPQEAHVARLAATGLSNRELAAELFLSEKTIEAHLGRIYRKLGIRSRGGLASALAGSRVAGQERDFPDSSDAARA